MLSQSQFYARVAQALGDKITNNDTKKVLDAIAKVVSAEVVKTGAVKIPNIAIIRVRKTAAREACSRKAFGKEIEVAAKPASVRVRMTAVKHLRSKVSL